MRAFFLLLFVSACGGTIAPSADDGGSPTDDLTNPVTTPNADLAQGGEPGNDPGPIVPADCHAIDGKITAILKNASSTYATEPKTIAESSKPVILLARAIATSTGDATAQAIYSPGDATQFFKLAVQSDCSVQLVSLKTTTECLDAGSGDTQLTQQKCDATSKSQLWTLTQNADKTTTLPNYTLASADDRCIEPATTLSGAVLDMKPCDGTFAQQYYLPGTVESVTTATFAKYFQPNLSLYTAPSFKSATTPNINPYKDSAGHTVPWQLLLPPGYDESNTSKTYPVVVYLHGSGESGSSNTSKVLVNGAEIFSTPEMQEKFPAIVIVPQCPTGDFCWGIGLNPTTDTALATHELVQYVMKTYHGDPKRVYVSGLSIGGVGTWDFIGRWSDLFTAALPLSGSQKLDPATEPHTGWLATNDQTPQMYVNIPIWATNGASDTTIGIHDDVDGIPDIDSLPGGETKFSLIQCEPAAPHNPCVHAAWAQILQTPGTLDWLFAQSK